jgi:hypothetical protein
LELRRTLRAYVAAASLQKDRCYGRGPFPYYKVAGKVLYDLAEVRALIRAGRVDVPKSGKQPV